MASQLETPTSPPSPTSPIRSPGLTAPTKPIRLHAYIEHDDIVATQGAHLDTLPPTPVWNLGHYNPTFAADLHKRLESAIRRQYWRRRKYHEAADEYLYRFTPPEVREKHYAEVEAAWSVDVTTDEDTDDDSKSKGGNKNKEAVNAAVAQEKTVVVVAAAEAATPAASNRLRKLPHQADGLPTPPPPPPPPPPLSSQNTTTTTRTRKRRLTPDDDVEDGEKGEHSTKRRKGRKRHQAPDADNEDEIDIPKEIYQKLGLATRYRLLTEPWLVKLEDVISEAERY